MVCVRHRCHAAQVSLERVASRSPALASLVTSRTPVRPRATRERRNAVQAGPSPARRAHVEAQRRSLGLVAGKTALSRVPPH